MTSDTGSTRTYTGVRRWWNSASAGSRRAGLSAHGSDKLAVNYTATVKLAMIRRYLRKLTAVTDSPNRA